MPCISFILPIYNMERLLPRALRSLRAQTLTDFEAILINDGSKDGERRAVRTGCCRGCAVSLY